MKKILTLFMLCLGIGTNVYGTTTEEGLLFEAAKTCNLDMVKALIDAGADVNARDKYDKTPLFPAAYYGHVDIINALIDAGAKVNVKDCMGEAPMFLVIKSGNVLAVEAFINADALLNFYDRYGQNLYGTCHQ